jgi:hypothetical protein
VNRRLTVTIIVSVKINDGIVMAADSAGTMSSGQVYVHANKITNLCEGVPVGAMSTGAGGIGTESVETLLKDLGRRFDGRDPANPEWRLDHTCYTMGEIAGRLRTSCSKRRPLSARSRPTCSFVFAAIPPDSYLLRYGR